MPEDTISEMWPYLSFVQIRLDFEVTTMKWTDELFSNAACQCISIDLVSNKIYKFNFNH